MASKKQTTRKVKAADLALTHWNSAEYLRNETDIAAYLEAVRGNTYATW
jgi:DNA-binding phage protein